MADELDRKANFVKERSEEGIQEGAQASKLDSLNLLKEQKSFSNFQKDDRLTKELFGKLEITDNKGKEANATKMSGSDIGMKNSKQAVDFGKESSGVQNFSNSTSDNYGKKTIDFGKESSGVQNFSNSMSDNYGKKTVDFGKESSRIENFSNSMTDGSDKQAAHLFRPRQDANTPKPDGSGDDNSSNHPGKSQKDTNLGGSKESADSWGKHNGDGELRKENAESWGKHTGGPGKQDNQAMEQGDSHYGVNPNTGRIERMPNMQTLDYRPYDRDAWIREGSHFGVDPNTGEIRRTPNTQTLDYRPYDRDAYIREGSHFGVDPKTGEIRRMPNLQQLNDRIEK